MYPYGDWRDLCGIRSKIWNFDQIFIQPDNLCLNSINFGKTDTPDVHKIFKIEKIKWPYNSQSQMSNSLTNEEIKESYSWSNIFVSNILANSVSKSSKCWRRDVINKSILRYFHKFMKNLFVKLLKDSSSLRKKAEDSSNEDSFASSIIRALKKIELVKSGELNEQSNKSLHNSLVEYVKWVIYGNKIFDSNASSNLSISISYTKKSNIHFNSLGKLNELNTPAKIMNDLLLRYNHCKLQKFFEDGVLRRMFLYFIKMEKDNLIGILDESKKSKFIEAIDDFERNILFFQ